MMNSLFDLRRMVNFAAIDFETANKNSSSICSVGIVIVREGIICKRIYELIHPFPNFYDPYFSNRIHNIFPWDTDSKPTFPKVWEIIAPQIQGLTLIAHNSAFDEKALRSVYASYGLNYPNYKFLCTLKASRKAFPSLESHRLPAVCSHLGINFTNHHHALADAEG